VHVNIYYLKIYCLKIPFSAARREPSERARRRDQLGHDGDAQTAARPRPLAVDRAQKIDLDAITGETLIFEGIATEACRAKRLRDPQRGRQRQDRGRHHGR